jgi:hypothetical protein
MVTNRQRQMLLQALTLIEQVCKENEEIEIVIGDSVWLELDNFLNPVPAEFMPSLPKIILPEDEKQ